MLEGEQLACYGRQCFTHFYYIIGIGPSILVNDSSARVIYHINKHIFYQFGNALHFQMPSIICPVISDLNKS